LASLHLQETAPNCTYRDHKGTRKVTHKVTDDKGVTLRMVCRGCATAALAEMQAIEDGRKREDPAGEAREATPEEVKQAKVLGTGPATK